MKGKNCNDADVIKKLQYKYIMTVVGILAIVFSIVFISVNISNRQLSERQNRQLLTRLIATDGRELVKTINSSEFSKMSIKTEDGITSVFATPYGADRTRNSFCVMAGFSGQVTSIISDFPIHYTSDEICSLVNEVFSLGEERGVYSGMLYQVAKKPYGYLAAFVDVRLERNMQNQLFRVTLLIYILSLGFSCVIAWLLSLWAIKPVREAFDKQRQFVADASHELKTPLSTIAANMDVLVSETGENRWTGYINSEVERMSDLVKDLLYLAKCDSGATQYTMNRFDVSRAVESAVLPFETAVFERNMTLETHIESGLEMTGDEKRIQQLVIILLDNAVKQSEEGAVITVKLSGTGSHRTLSVRNTGAGISDEDRKRIFERFYRADSSRTRDTGGSGLGLSIAKSIADAHQARLEVASDGETWTEFTLSI
ncbi:MAG: GHKL domain-containing protein [Treponema sp.]|nr:GHKL domain-containing protein [Candidatus Treponema caballi]